MDRYWFLTWRTYGTWLPGDERGFVGHYLDDDGHRVVDNIPGTPPTACIPPLWRYAERQLKCPPIQLDIDHAEVLLEQFFETERYRGWKLLAIAILAEHVHVVLGVPGDPDPEKLLADLKSNGSRSLNQQWSRPGSGKWWARSGSKRKLPNDQAVLGAIKYVVEQKDALLIWTAPIPELGLAGGRIV